MIVFARTRIATEQLAQRLEVQGFSAAALNGNVPQKQREQALATPSLNSDTGRCSAESV